MIDAEKANYTIVRMCRLLGVDRRRYYEWRRRRAAGPTAREQRRAEVTVRIRAHHEASDGTYGAPRILHDLRDEGEIISRKTVAKCMRQAQIVGISPRAWHPPTTIPGPDPAPAPDLVKWEFDPGERDRVWFSDITYLATGEGWAYLCAIRDGHTRRVLGRTVADHLRADLVEDALRQAVALRGELPAKVVFHADRGCQYTSQQIADLAGELDLLRSMGRTGVCWDAMAEAFNSLFKAECIRNPAMRPTGGWASIRDIEIAIAEYVDWFNHRRLHGEIGQVPPAEYETAHWASHQPVNYVGEQVPTGAGSR